FAHVVVDEAQELTDAQWQMVLARCPSRSLTVVGDRAQARRPFTESWGDRLDRVGVGTPRVATLTLNYRTPKEVMAAAEPVIRAVLPDANVPTSVRSTGEPVHHGSLAQLPELLVSWLEQHTEGLSAVIAAPEQDLDLPDHAPAHRVTPELGEGLESGRVVLVRPNSFGTGTQGTVDRYVARTRATQQLVLLSWAAAGGSEVSATLPVWRQPPSAPGPCSR